MSQEAAEKTAQEIFGKIDSDGSGVIEYTEYLRTLIEKESLLSRENLRKAFLYFDKDQSQTIEKSEIVDWLSAGGVIPEEVVQELIEEADMNGDGTIDLEEFEQILADRLEIE